ncbi:MAG: prolyl oligopeptidase family serine peptidase [Actinomycetota bacterium]|nr:prolyl oligopeptidase family serine peptidase [Actinomycetota bacterium]
MSAYPFGDLAAYAALPRLTGLALSIDGTRLVASMQQPDEKGARYASSLWDLALDGGEPSRLTRSEQGESAPAFLPDGGLLFISARPDPQGGPDCGDEPALWLLPRTGEARLVALSPGGLGGPVVATQSGAVVLSGSRLVDSADAEDDARRREDRAERKITAILHTGMPIRHWDHELGDESPRLLHLASAGTGVEAEPPRDLAPDAAFALTEADYSISADGSTVASTWRERERGGRMPHGVSLIDVATGRRTVLAADPGVQYTGPRLSPDGRRLALSREAEGDFDTPAVQTLQLYELGTGEGPFGVDLGDLHPTEWVWGRDSNTLFIAGDWHGRTQVVQFDAALGAVVRLVASDAAYSNLCPSPDGRSVYALRSTVDAPPAPVRLDATAEGQAPTMLATPAAAPALPGRLVEVDSALPDGSTVRGWLCLPAATAGPAPLMLWVHGGPFLSYNAWNWRWNPWVAVARGYAVLLPDPALSTGYGAAWIARAWPHRAEPVWRDLEALLEEVAAREDVDATRTACLGGSFGGYMTNWIAGHTDRFRAIVTHAGLWALDQQHTTTDAAYWKSGLFGTPAEHPEWYAENSPHHFADHIRTPMLVVHGNRDYRVPVSEALRLWWDLVSRFDGEPEDLPHRFLQLTGENHWVLSPANAVIWYETVLGFCDRHVLGNRT